MTPNPLRQALNITRGRGLRAQLVRSGVGSAALQALSRVALLALGIVLARGLGAEGYGIYAYAFAIMSLLMVGAEAGVPTLLMRQVAANASEGNSGLLRGMLIRSGQMVLLVSVLLAVIGVSVLALLADEPRGPRFYTMLFMLLVLPPAALVRVVDHAMRGLHHVVAAQAVAMFLSPVLVLAIVAGLFIASPNLRQPQFAMSAQLFGAIIVLIVGTQLLIRFLPRAVRLARPEYRTREWLRNAFPFVLIGGAGIINSQADIVMLGWLRPATEVGLYRVAVQGAALVVFGLQVVNSVVAPQFARLYAQHDMVRLQRLVTYSARVVLLTAVPLAITFVLMGRNILGWIFGAEFGAAYLPLAILAVGQLVNAGFGSVGFLMNMTGHESDSARTLWQTASLNIVLNLILIPIYGMGGAAIASAVSLAAWNFILYRFARRHLGLTSAALRFGTLV